MIHHESFDFGAEEMVYIEYLLSRIIEESVTIFDEVTTGDFSYWIDDPVVLCNVRMCFKKVFRTHGVNVACKVFPEPQLPAEQAPLRLIIRGDFKSWRIDALEDLRELSPAQQRQEIDEQDWMITLFGNHTDASPPQEALPAQPVKEDTADQPQDPPYEGVDLKAANLRTLKPLYSIKRVLQRLPQLAREDPVTAQRLLLGLHEKLWHATASDFANLLLRAGMPSEVIELSPKAVSNCAVCWKFARLPSRPKTKASLAAHFGDEVKMDM